MVLWPRHHTFLISFPTVMLRVHHDMCTHCNMRHTNCRTNYFKYSYFPHTIVLWNALPQAVVSSPTLVAFKTSLRRGRMPQNCNLVLDSGVTSRGLARIQKLPVQNYHFSQFCQSSSYLSHYKTKQFHQSWPTSASLQDRQTGL